jgi:fatty acid/phospholipid biosynthesis enzyme
MGGDYAPQAIVAGAVHAAKEYGVGIILVGIE